MIYHAVAATSHGSAIVSLERSVDRATCIGIERPGTSLAELATSVLSMRSTLGEFDRIVVDAGAGLGSALWKVLEEPARDGRYVLERSQGRQRQAIIDSLIAYVTMRTLQFAPGLQDEAAVKRALGTFRKEVGEDGILGSEILTALAVGLHARFRMPPRVW